MNRRSLLQGASWAALANLSGISPLRSISALAQNNSSSDYKALICLFMRGGNDSNNMIVPVTSSEFADYAKGRGPLALPQSGLLHMPGIGYGLHPALGNLSKAFASGNAAMIANVGSLVQPTTAEQYQKAAVALPEALMSHQDQQQAWEDGGYRNGVGTGWAGRVADSLDSAFNSSNLPMVTLLGSATNFGRGLHTAAMSVPGNSQSSGLWCSAGGSCGARATAQQQLMTFNTGVDMIQQDQLLYQDASKYNSFYNGVLAGAAPLKTAFPSSCALSPALNTIATMIQLRQQIGARRQIFLINFGSFDTHASQLSTQQALLAQVDQALGIFAQSMQELGVYDNVALFTASDFARTLQYNGSLGTDHAWGGHHFVMGGPVKGGKMYGTFPRVQMNGPDDIDGSGRWVPTTALSQYMATLATWFGVPPQALPAILPGLSNFSTPNLGFI